MKSHLLLVLKDFHKSAHLLNYMLSSKIIFVIDICKMICLSCGKEMTSYCQVIILC